MSKTRLEAFTDAILAIIMTVLVLELTIPTSGSWQALIATKEEFAVYALSFYFIAIYWVNHHHLMQLVEKVNGLILWTNIIMIFFISLIPFVTAWVGKNLNDFAPCMCYGILFLLINISFGLVMHTIAKVHEEGSKFHSVYNEDRKSVIAIVLSIVVILLGFIQPVLILIGRLVVSTLWVVPSKHAERCAEDSETCEIK